MWGFDLNGSTWSHMTGYCKKSRVPTSREDGKVLSPMSYYQFNIILIDHVKFSCENSTEYRP